LLFDIIEASVTAICASGIGARTYLVAPAGLVVEEFALPVPLPLVLTDPVESLLPPETPVFPPPLVEGLVPPAEPFELPLMPAAPVAVPVPPTAAAPLEAPAVPPDVPPDVPPCAIAADAVARRIAARRIFVFSIDRAP
jgi:hypothetical protein